MLSFKEFLYEVRLSQKDVVRSLKRKLIHKEREKERENRLKQQIDAKDNDVMNPYDIKKWRSEPQWAE